MNKSNHSAASADAAGAGLIASMLASDGLHTHGIYRAVNVGPVESFRDEYVRTRDELWQLEASPAARLFRAKRILALRSKLAAIPIEEKWSAEAPNIVTTVGKNDILDKYLAGSAYTASPRMLLKGTGTAVIADTQASHASWLEQGLANAPTYTGNRPTPAFSAASGGVKSTSSAVAFAITSTGTVFGVGINNGGSATKDDTTGILVSAGDFTGGSRAVINGDTLSVTYSLTLT